MLHDKFKLEVQESLKARDALRTTVIRGLLAAFTNELVATKRKPDATLADEEVLAVIRRAVKQRKDSIEQFRAGNREDLAKNEEAELKILETYLPAMMPRDEIEKIARQRATELGVVDKTKANMLMGNLMKELKGKADGTEVRAVVDSLFA